MVVPYFKGLREIACAYDEIIYPLVRIYARGKCSEKYFKKTDFMVD
jgi:hypothetical protein